MRRAAMAAILLAGCATPGPKVVKLDPTQATAIEVALVGGGKTYCAGGDPSQLDVAVTTTDGKRLDTWSRGEPKEGKLPASTFSWTSSWGTVDADGLVQIPKDPIAALGKQVTVEVEVV